MIQTKGVNTWDLNLNVRTVGSETEYMSKDQTLVLDPQIPFLYVPSSVFRTMTNKLQQLYGPNDINCASLNNYCKFDMPCSQLTPAILSVDSSIWFEMWGARNHGGPQTTEWLHLD